MQWTTEQNPSLGQDDWSLAVYEPESKGKFHEFPVHDTYAISDPNMAAKAKAVQALGKFASCDIGDALVKLGIKHGGYLSGLRMYSPHAMNGPSKIFGPAYTVRMVPASDKSSPSPPRHFADGIPKDSVVFVSQPKGLISACWGGLMSTRAQNLGAAGVVIDGRFRDIEEHRALNMGLFARGISILGSNTFTRSSELNVPVIYENVEIDEKVTINPGDYILGDADGVVSVPPSTVEECLRLCQERYEIDEETRKCLEKGDEMGPTIKRLRK